MVTKLKFKKDAELVVASDFFYDLTDGGYIRPEDMLEPKDAARVRAAIELITQFRDEAEDNDLLEHC